MRRCMSGGEYHSPSWSEAAGPYIRMPSASQVHTQDRVGNRQRCELQSPSRDRHAREAERVASQEKTQRALASAQKIAVFPSSIPHSACGPLRAAADLGKSGSSPQQRWASPSSRRMMTFRGLSLFTGAPPKVLWLVARPNTSTQHHFQDFLLTRNVIRASQSARIPINTYSPDRLQSGRLPSRASPAAPPSHRAHPHAV